MFLLHASFTAICQCFSISTCTCVCLAVWEVWWLIGGWSLHTHIVYIRNAHTSALLTYTKTKSHKGLTLPIPLSFPFFPYPFLSHARTHSHTRNFTRTYSHCNSDVCHTLTDKHTLTHMDTQLRLFGTPSFWSCRIYTVPCDGEWERGREWVCVRVRAWEGEREWEFGRWQ